MKNWFLLLCVVCPILIFSQNIQDKRNEFTELVKKNPQARELLSAHRLRLSFLDQGLDTPLGGAGNTLFMWASYWHDFELARFLARCGSDINLVNKRGEDFIDLMIRREGALNSHSSLPFAFELIRPRLIEKGMEECPIGTSFLFRNHYQIVSQKKRVDNPLIPRRIHQIWIGPHPVPPRVIWMMETWQELHPDWEYKLWTDRHLKDFHMENQDLFDKQSNWGAKSDILRCEILERYGGVYVDVDFQAVRPLDPLHYQYDFYCGELNGKGTGEVCNALIASRPHHPIIRACIDSWKGIQTSFGDDPMEVIRNTGPIFLTNRLIDYLTTPEGAMSRSVVLPHEAFFSFPNDQRSLYWEGKLDAQEVVKQFTTRGSYAIHYWGTSWQK